MAPVLVQEAASDSKLIALFPPACPGPTALFGRAVRGRLSPRKPPTTSPVPKQGRRGGGGLPARQGRSRFFTQNPSLSRENMG